MDVLFWVGVRSTDPLLLEKHGNFDYFKYSKLTWKYWCDKNNVLFFEYDTPSILDTGTHKVTWQRWFDIEDQLKDINWRRVAVVDASYMVKWNSPNFFEMVTGNLNTFQALENVRWMYESIQGYQELFPNVNFNLKRYIDCGFQIFEPTHLKFLKKVKQFYFDNNAKILQLQKSVSKGTDQPVYNYLLQKENVNFEFKLPNSYNINHMNRFNWFSHNWQLQEDSTPFFIKYGNIWKFSGFDRRQRTPLMQQTWDLIKENYE